MKAKKVVMAALRRDPDLADQIKGSLKGRVDEAGRLSTVVQAVGALEPILADAVRKRPSRLGLLGLKSAHLIAQLASEDDTSSGRLAAIAGSGTVGIVFADVAGFTEFTSRNGDAQAIALLGRVHDAVAAATAVGRGEIVKRFGDGYLLAFPSASQAVRAAVDLAARVDRDAGRTYGTRVRVAVHAGEPLVEGDDLLGHDVNLTARLLDVAEPGEVVVSDAAREAAERRLRKISFSDRREVKVRGLALRVGVATATAS
ncbi:MAG TPA: adenylate/guanylate cyclase domain-containing protein [Actinomycetota bacterium]|nr:adenylate/guanylate cyclase domain-containing protein [Actinomycetota bacterium]